MKKEPVSCQKRGTGFFPLGGACEEENRSGTHGRGDLFVHAAGRDAAQYVCDVPVFGLVREGQYRKTGRIPAGDPGRDANRGAGLVSFESPI